jgi:hypothetical protein
MNQQAELKEATALAARRLSVDLSNRHVDGFLVTAKNSGTHWLRFMLSQGLARQYGLPAPLHSSGRASDDFIGHPKWGRKYPRVPFIGSSHNVPSALFAQPWFVEAVRSPPIVVLVRDVREAMLSHWVKWGPQLDLSLHDYVRSPAPGRKDVADAWWYIDFFNRWGRMAVTFPERVLIVRYEDLIEDAHTWLERINTHLGLGLEAEALSLAAKFSDRGSLRARLDPEYGEEIVPDPIRRGSASFTAEDEAHLRAVFRRRLRHAFGYAGLRSEEAKTDAAAEVAPARRPSSRSRDEAR